jgi:hypothetical protein
MVLWMKVPLDEGLAAHVGPESCVVAREGRGEALTGVRTGWVLSCESEPPLREQRSVQGADAIKEGGRQHPVRRQREACGDPAQSKTPSMSGRTMYGNREILWLSADEGSADRVGKS